jgi:hypothetical protein
MKRAGLILLTLAVAAGTVAVLQQRRARSIDEPMRRAPMATGVEDDADARDEMEFLMLRDPRTGQIPRDIRARELRFARTLPVQAARTFRNGPYGAVQSQALVWTERGPSNVGGRTRAFAVDVTAPATLIAGAVGGGIWRSTDDGTSWSLRTSPGQIHSATCIAQDRRAGQTGTWYVGSGEIRGSTSNATRWGSLYLGDGIFKSTDAGVSWTLLPSTSSGTPQTTDSFDYVINVATNPANLAQAEVLAATFRGIYRSIDGGGSWNQVLASDSGFTDVAITNAGVMYATTQLSSVTRVWRSTNGTTWTAIQPATFTGIINRVTIGLAPSNAAAAYFFIQGTSFPGPSVAGHQLWKYTYVSGDGSGAGGSWVNRGGNLPADLSTQAGYDQVITVKPDDENFVVIGGTNLYRSTNGFATALTTTTIGGYPFYPGGNHHPDLHAGVFSPVNSSVYYSAGDGGIARADNIALGNMVWTSLNNGYNVTQFYSVAIAPDGGSNVILAGAQDNGSQLGTAPGASNWLLAFGGDGTIVEVSPQASDRLYTQYQNGPIQRQNWDGSNLADMTPTGAANQLFVNPIVLDPNNSNLLYYAAGNSPTNSFIWRNNDPGFANTTYGWTALTATDVGAGSGYARRISALGISKAANPNVLYYGTIDGVVMKAVDIHGVPTVSTITPPGLFGGTASGGFVRCVAVDPADSQKALVVFGNYNFPSLWYTTNGGTSWTDVEGNLAGSAGPSIRWATILSVDGQPEVFLATSVGVLSTTALTGGATVWAQEATTEIGNVIAGYMDYRESDRTLAVATHGRGVFTTTIPSAVGVGDTPKLDAVTLHPGFPNPTRGATTLSFDLTRPAHVSLRVHDVSGRLVAVLVNGPREAGRNTVHFATDRLAAGVYTCVLRAGNVVRTRTLTVTR